MNDAIALVTGIVWLVVSLLIAALLVLCIADALEVRRRRLERRRYEDSLP